jgi:hypothetical protein
VNAVQNKNRLSALTSLTIVFLIAISPFLALNAAGWSNGGYSTNPAVPDYGTHDWIADHALDWLPQQEKQFLADNKAAYLYGTELPDNSQAADGIGDTTKHHVYYHADGSLQDDAAAVRAREEYAKAVDSYKAGNMQDAAKRLGVVAHYVADMAVFGHVMAASTAWGDEHHHDDYENYVNTRTNSYVDTFNSYLVFDGSLTSKTAYDAALTLAHDTTFDEDGDLTCVWMDTHYSWSDLQFASRAGESLNLAVNAVADVLHTFYAGTVIPELPTPSLGLALVLLLILPVCYLLAEKDT